MHMLPSAVFPLAQSSGKLSPVLVALILAVLVILILWLVLRLLRGSASAGRARVTTIPEKRTAMPAAAAATPAAAPVKPDDLEIIEGIGPKIAGVLRAAGVTTFAQLASMEPSKISDIVHAGGIRLADPRSWPDQARLAAVGDQAGLSALQDKLKAGRTV
jgi:large subunit ribosomal protein L17